MTNDNPAIPPRRWEPTTNRGGGFRWKCTWCGHVATNKAAHERADDVLRFYDRKLEREKIRPCTEPLATADDVRAALHSLAVDTDISADTACRRLTLVGVVVERMVRAAEMSRPEYGLIVAGDLASEVAKALRGDLG